MRNCVCFFKCLCFVSASEQRFSAETFKRLFVHGRRRILYKRTYLHTPCIRVLLEKLTGFQLVKKFPAFYGTRKFITAFTSVRQLFLPWARSIQSITPHPTSWRSILILFSVYALVSQVVSSLMFPHQILVYAYPILHTCYTPRPFYSSRFGHPKNNRWWVQIIKLLIV